MATSSLQAESLPAQRAGGALVLCAHGTRSVEGRAAVRDLVAAVRARGVIGVREAYVDVHGPALSDVLTDGDAVVPLLLAPGYHVDVDITEAAAARREVRVGSTLGPAPELVAVLADRLAEVGLGEGDAVVLAAAGSSVEAAAEGVRACARALADHLDREVHVAYGASRLPSVPDLVAALRDDGAARVVLASYLLAPGHFHSRLNEAGADAVTRPLVEPGRVDPRLVDLVLRRWRETVPG